MENKKLKPAKYWEWRTTIAEMQLADSALKFGELQHEGMLKDQEIARLRAGVFKLGLSTLKDKKELAHKEYKILKEKLEKELDMSLNDCVIDDVTFEVKKLESDK